MFYPQNNMLNQNLLCDTPCINQTLRGKSEMAFKFKIISEVQTIDTIFVLGMVAL